MAIASREAARAAEYARLYGIPRSYGNYNDLLGDVGIDAVYIPLPQSLHAEYTVKAARSGKHVLVEKPAALTAREVSSMIHACERHGVLLMEGLMYRFLPIQQRVRQLVGDGTIGRLRYIDFNWCVNARAIGRNGFRFDKRLGGGALYDLGVYGIDFMKFLMPRGKPRLLFAGTYRQNRSSVDEFTHALFAVDGIVVSVTVSYATDANYYTISGEKGSIHVPRGVAGRVVDTLLQVHLLEGDNRYEEHFPAENSYILEMEHFARCIEKGETPVISPRVSLENIRMVEQIIGKSVALPRLP